MHMGLKFLTDPDKALAPPTFPSPFRTQVETPGMYGSLEEYFRHYRNPQLSRVSTLSNSDSGKVSALQ